MDKCGSDNGRVGAIAALRVGRFKGTSIGILGQSTTDFIRVREVSDLVRGSRLCLSTLRGDGGGVMRDDGPTVVGVPVGVTVVR